MTSSVLNSQSVIITTAMAVSGAVIFLSLCRIKHLPSIHQLPTNQTSSYSSNLRSCLSSDSLKTGKKDKKKKRVKFADDVKGNKDETNYAKKKKNGINNKEKSTKIRGMPANRAALYQGILRDRIHRVECSH